MSQHKTANKTAYKEDPKCREAVENLLKHTDLTLMDIALGYVLYKGEPVEFSEDTRLQAKKMLWEHKS